MVDGDDGRGTGNPDDPRGDLLPGEADHGLSRAAQWRPGPAAMLAAGLVILLVLGWRFTTWRVDEGALVPCGSFTPNPSVWHPVAAGAGRAAARGSGSSPPASESRPTTPLLDAPRGVAWAAAVRETNGLVHCAGLEGRTRATVERMLGPHTDAPAGSASEVDGLGADELAWAFTREAPNVPATAETTAVIVRFREGRAASVRPFHRARRR